MRCPVAPKPARWTGDDMHDVRINISRLVRRILFALVLPVVAAGGLDAWIGTYPALLVVTSVICIPLATFLVIRTALAEMDSVVRQITPEPPETTVIESGTVMESGTAVEAGPAGQAGDDSPTVQYHEHPA
jgi:hypothetical protein